MGRLWPVSSFYPANSLETLRKPCQSSVRVGGIADRVEPGTLIQMYSTSVWPPLVVQAEEEG
jgi:hypothetical protein